MAFFQMLYQEVISFLGIEQLLEMYRMGNYQSLLTLKGVLAAVSQVIPFLLLIEVVRWIYSRR